MSDLPMNTRATVIPCVTYRDAIRAIEWLCTTFGFEKRAVYEDPPGHVVHAELTFGNGMLMVGSSSPDTDYGRLMVQPDEVGGRATQTVVVITQQPDEIYRRARAAGAAIIFEIKDASYGGRGFSCRDLEDHIWSFGSYDPWQTPASG